MDLQLEKSATTRTGMQELLRQSLVCGTLGRVGAVVATLLLNVLLAMWMETSEYATYILISSLVFFLAPAISFGCCDVMIGMMTSEADNDTTETVYAAALLTLAGGLVTSVVWSVFCVLTRNQLWSGDHWQHLLVTLLLSVTLAYTNLIGDVFRGLGFFGLGSALAGFTGSFVQNAIALVILAASRMVSIELSVSYVFGVLIFSQLAIFLWLLQRIGSRSFRVYIFGSRSQLVARCSRMYRHSMPILGWLVLTGIGSQLDVVLAALWLSVPEMAAYGAARRVAVLIGYPYMMFNISLRPIVNHFRLDQPESKRALSRASFITVACAIGIALPLVLVANQLFAGLGKDWDLSWTIMSALAVGYVLQSATGFGGTILSVTFNGSYLLLSQIVSLTLYLVLSLLLVRSALGSAIGFSCLIVGRSLLDGVMCYRITGVFPAWYWNRGRTQVH